MAAVQKKTEKENNKNGIKNSWPKGIWVVIVDSMVGSIDERKMLSKYLIKVKTFSGATCSDMYHYLVGIFEEKPDYVILHFGTNDVAHYEGTKIAENLLKLKSFNVEQLPTKYVVLSHPHVLVRIRV